MDTANESGGQGQYLGLFIGEEEYAIGILRVKEILQFEEITRVPRTPPSIRGVINVRGSVVPVIDLAVKFGLPETPVTKRTCIVILEVQLDDEPTVMGVMADSVSQVIDLAPEEILPPPAFGVQVHVDYLVGMGRWGKRFILILDIDRVLSAAELQAAAALDAAAQEGGEEVDGANAGEGGTEQTPSALANEEAARP